MVYSTQELRLVQENILVILKEVVRVCIEEHIPYFIIGGTALGAVRHKGFIPWDDDIDIGMTRENYERFLRIFQKKADSSFFLQYYETETTTPFYFAKVRMNNTLFVEKYCSKLKMHQGVYLDIFPYDKIPVDETKRKTQLNFVRFWSELYIAKSTTGIFHTQQKNINYFMKYFFRGILHLLLTPICKDYLYKMLNAESKRYNNEDAEYVSYIKYPFLKMREIDVKNLEKINFENITISCCGNIECYLKSHFGSNYMTLPSVKDRVNHRPILLKL